VPASKLTKQLASSPRQPRVSLRRCAAIKATIALPSISSCSASWAAGAMNAPLNPYKSSS